MQALYIGSDYNYAHNNDFRRMFLDNSVESDDLKLQVRGGNEEGAA